MFIRKLACQHCLENDFCADEEQGNTPLIAILIYKA